MITADGLERLDAALAWIAEHPDEHDQAMWFARTDCGTTMCLAGVVAMQAGAKPVWEFEGEGDDEAYSVELPDGTVRRVEPYARELLGIDGATAHDLFGAGTAKQLHRVRDRLAGAAPAHLPILEGP